MFSTETSGSKYFVIVSPLLRLYVFKFSSFRLLMKASVSIKLKRDPKIQELHVCEQLDCLVLSSI